MLVATLTGALTGIGLLLVVMGLRKTEQAPPEIRRGLLHRVKSIEQLGTRFGLAIGAAFAIWLLAFWPAAIVLAFIAGFTAPTLLGAKKRRNQAIAMTEAVATWAEQLRDMISTAAGLNEAISGTAGVAPLMIRPHVQLLARGLRYEQLPVLLRRFANELDDPAADQIAAALSLASERRGQNLTELLGEVASATREEATMRLRTETSRAHTYGDARAATTIVLVVFLVLLITNRDYLAPFDSFSGQMVLAGVGVLWAVALQGLTTLARVRRPDRILAVNQGSQA